MGEFTNILCSNALPKSRTAAFIAAICVLIIAHFE
jgi:hypothetical protein